MAYEMTMIISGIAKDTHEKFPIRYDVSENGNPFFIGCTMEVPVEKDGKLLFTKRMNIRAFGEQADELAHVSDGMEITIKGSFDQQKSDKDGKYYPIVTVAEVISA
jgi:hypothetical protein